jgi:hypothetical protein
MSTIPKTRHIPKFLLAITAGNQVATTLPSSNLSDSQPLCTSGPRRVVSFDELKDVACGAGFTVSSAAALAGVCSSPHIQQAFWAAIEEECQRSRLTLSECLSQFKALSNHPIVCSKEKANNYDQYKLSTHSFNEYRTEQDITRLLEVDDDKNASGCASSPYEALSGTHHHETNHQDQAIGGDLGEPGPVDGEIKTISIVLMAAVCVLSLTFLSFVDKNLYSSAINSELVKTFTVLTAHWVPGSFSWKAAPH